MPVLSRVILRSPFLCILFSTTGIFICLSVPIFAQEVEINVEGNPNLRQVVRVNSTITALNTNVSSPSANSNTTALANSTAVNSTLTNSAVSGNLTTTNTTSVNGTTTNSTTNGNTTAIVVPPDSNSSSSVNSAITNTNGTTSAANTSLSSVNSNATVGANLTSSSTTNNNTSMVDGTSSSANSTTISTAVTTTNTTASNVTTNGTTNGTNANGTSISTVTSSNTTIISANGSSAVSSANGTTTNGTGLNVTNTTTASSNSTSGNTTANSAGISSTNATINNSTLPVISASAATNRSSDGAATLPSVFILGAASTTPAAAQTTTPAPTVNTPIPTTLTTTATVAPSTTPATTPTTTTPTTAVTAASTTTGPTASSVLVTPSIRNDSTRPSIVVNIDIDLGSLHPTDASTTSPTPTTAPTISPSTPTATTPLTTNVPGQVTTTSSGNIPITPVTGTSVNPNGLSTLASATSVPPSKPTLGELLANKNGTQVVCFSLPFDLLEKLLPLISSLGISPNSVTTPPPSASSPLYNPLTSAPTQPPATIPGVSTINPGTPPNGNYPFLGPFGAGSYGGFRPTVPPQPTYAVTAATTTTSRSMNPYPVMPPQQVMQPAGVIPYYTYAPGTGSHYANAQPAAHSGYGGPSISVPAYPLTYDKPVMAASGSYGGTLAQAPAQAVISTVDSAMAPLQSPKGVSVLESKALTRGPLASPLNRQPSEANLPAWCTNTNLVPDAITVTADGLTHVFIGNQVLSVKNASSADKKVVQNPIQKIWRGLPPDVGRINAATTRPDGTTYLFSGPSFWKFDSLYRVARDSPRKTSIGFPGVAQMDAVYQDLLSDGDMSFLQGPGYFTYNHKKFPPYQGPASLSDLGLPSEVTKVDSAFTDSATRDLLFVVGTAMYRVSPTNNGLARSYKVKPSFT
ncbi:hypothetical protein RvY_16290-2 [Ramazzottius varieornatus]|uniref:Uncharacterized protein n=1 Tax=Ramazzottius varieornatus TaxID=947166 RepID=A0A1D1W0T5_RAMVA|nr:hypothetical protein RvY_16290-2 [Ramazzottius varieornatus]